MPPVRRCEPSASRARRPGAATSHYERRSIMAECNKSNWNLCTPVSWRPGCQLRSVTAALIDRVAESIDHDAIGLSRWRIGSIDLNIEIKGFVDAVSS